MRLLLVIILALVQTSCERQDPLSLAAIQKETRFVKLCESIAEILRAENQWEISVLSGKEYNVARNIELVAQREVDFAITTSDMPPNQPDVRTVMPLYPEILLVLYNKELGNPMTLQDLLRGRRVGVGPKELPLSRIMLQIIKDFGVSANEFTPVYNPLNQVDVISGEMDVLFTFLGLNPEQIEKHINDGARLFSFDDVDFYGKGSTVDGYLLTHPERQSFIIPKTTFERFPEEPVLTLALVVTIITHRDMPSEKVYEFVETVFNKSSYLFRKNRILGFLSTPFDEAKLNFPLHEGTRQYLNRDQPSFMERYANVFALIFSIVLVLGAASSSINRIFRRRKKDRVDVYYQNVMEVASRPSQTQNEKRDSLEELQSLKTRAIQQLQNEKLAADESFIIFLKLVHHEIRRFERELDD
jgi:TRAP-type uncharacterized transport system substrate-binding protein